MNKKEAKIFALRFIYGLIDYGFAENPGDVDFNEEEAEKIRTEMDLIKDNVYNRAIKLGSEHFNSSDWNKKLK